MYRRVKRALGPAALCLGILLPTGTVLCIGSDGHLALELAALGGCADGTAESKPDVAGDDHCADSCLDTLVGTAEFKPDRSSAADSIESARLVSTFHVLAPLSAPDAAAFSSETISESSRWVRAFDAALRTTVALC
jgi:hypothetical protein